MQTFNDVFALMPLMLVGATAVAIMVGIAWRRQHGATAIVTAVGLNLALLSLGWLSLLGIPGTAYFVLDGLTYMASVLILVSALACVTLAHDYLGGYSGAREEFYLLLLCAVGGGLALSASQHLATLFFALELMSMPLYGMLAYTYRDQRSLEAGLKYLILSAAGTAFLLFGMALLYAQSGRLDFEGLVTSMTSRGSLWTLAGVGLILVGLGFKLSIVPFHLWTPDVYEGGPGPAITFLATASKVAVFVVILRLILAAPAFQSGALEQVLVVLAFVSMLAGNLLALLQSNLKRLLGYSSIAHFGYLMVALVVGEGLAVETAGVYLISYLLTNLGAFGVVTLVSSPYKGEDAAALHHYRGLFWRRPYLAAVLTVSLLSLAGIPFTVGFIGKFYVIALGVEAAQWWLVVGVILGSAIGLFYYLRVMVTLYLVEPGMRRRDAVDAWGWHPSGLVVVGVVMLVVVLGIYPTPMIDWMHWVAAASR
ncbi:NADH-quinone oxidoreductase subunit NuoN [Saccharospirillum salsuginis]|uniref:NADH-quinone oxidoreductase subunit N n=1 Tax=Saccharospirillum salsuginis TaxID=418750 RepID=A0A918K6Q4_9GAMM|nr:NADH-quinone oxidoreductase subunit NuoN [Saccharospirillum salsuginis]GGX52626.1 NADH-quinone oxidoreductase subunit N [Saccharospirillum salsuginis]